MTSPENPTNQNKRCPTCRSKKLHKRRGVDGPFGPMDCPDQWHKAGNSDPAPNSDLRAAVEAFIVDLNALDAGYYQRTEKTAAGLTELLEAYPGEERVYTQDQVDTALIQAVNAVKDEPFTDLEKSFWQHLDHEHGPLHDQPYPAPTGSQDEAEAVPNLWRQSFDTTSAIAEEQYARAERYAAALKRIAVWEEDKGGEWSDGPCQGIARVALDEPDAAPLLSSRGSAEAVPNEQKGLDNVPTETLIVEGLLDAVERLNDHLDRTRQERDEARSDLAEANADHKRTIAERDELKAELERQQEGVLLVSTYLADERDRAKAAQAKVERLKGALEKIEGEGPAPSWELGPMRRGLIDIYELARSSLRDSE